MKYLVALFVMLLLLARTSFAQVEQNRPDFVPPASGTPPQRQQMKPENTMMRKPSGRPLQGKLQACQKIGQNVTRKASNISDSVNKFIEKGDSIVQRVEDFYQNKLVSQGKTLSNHDTLVSNIEAKKTLTLDSATDLNSTASQFTCNETSPGLSMTSMREKMKTVRKNLQEYKVAIKNLIVAVHQLSSNGEPVPTISVEPTITPVIPTP